MSNYQPSEQEMLDLNLKDPDEIVEYILRFYSKNHVKTEDGLVNSLSECKPLRAAIDLQKQKRR